MILITSLPAARAGIERLRDRDQRHAALLESFEQFGQVLHAAGEPVELGDDHRLHLALIDQREQPLHAGPVQVLRRLAAVHDQLDDLGSLHDGHGADLRLLGFERNAVIGLFVG